MGETTQRIAQALAYRYTIEREIGAGGMATVYLAEDLKHKRKVAIKVLRPELAAALGADRFLREIEVTANLQHPHILPLYDSGTAEESTALPPYRPTAFVYYVMPYVEGESLRDRLNREKQLPIDDALTLATEVADALGSEHRQGVVHRDIKPENILLRDCIALRQTLKETTIREKSIRASGCRSSESRVKIGERRARQTHRGDSSPRRGIDTGQSCTPCQRERDELREIHAITLASGRSRLLATLPDPVMPWNVSISPNGRLLVAAVEERQTDAWIVDDFDPTAR